MSKKSLLAHSGCAALLAVASVPADAQSATGDGNATPDIIVTAQKREQKIQDVPSSVAVVTSTELSRANIVTLQDVASKVPGFNIVQGAAGPVGVRLILRGQNTGGQGAVVATVIDDIPISSTSSNAGSGAFGTDINTYDMSRIEVLRGPQGTLYGASSEGGLVKYVTNAPDLQRIHASAELLGSIVEHGGEGGALRGMVNVPILTDVAALRISAYDQYDAPWINNLLGGQRQSNGLLRNGGRASLLLKPIDNLTIRLFAIIDNIRGRGASQVTFNGRTSADPFGLPIGYAFNSYRPLPSRVSSQIYAANIHYAASFASLQSITSYSRQKTFYQNEVLGLANAFAPNSTVVFSATYPLTKVNQEFRVASLPSSHLLGLPFDWQLGAYYTRESVPNEFYYDAVDKQSGAQLRNVLIATGDVTYREIATYADTTLHILPTLELGLGGRYFWNRQLVRDLQGGPLLGTPTPVQQPTKTSAESGGIFSTSAKWKFTPDASLYARVASGYRPGGPVRSVFGVSIPLPATFKSDSTINYEVGVKGQFFDRRLTVDVAAFLIDWSDVQVTTRVTAGAVTANVVGNGGTARSQGLEWAFSLRPVRGLTLGTSGAYTDAKLTADAVGIGGFNGQQLPYVPKIAATVTADYDTPLTPGATGLIGGTWSFTGPRYSDFAVATLNNHLRIPAFSQLEVHAGLRFGHYGVEVFGRNLTDARGITFYNPIGVDVGGGLGSGGIIQPRTMGIKLNVTY